jgi:Domain of unknown function (DUF4271)
VNSLEISTFAPKLAINPSRTEEIKLKKSIFYKIFLLILFVSNSAFIKAQSPVPQAPEGAKPATTQTSTLPVATPTTTVSQPTIPTTIVTNPILEPLVQTPKRRRIRPVTPDSARLAAIRDSLARGTQGTNSAFNINPTGTPKADSTTKTATGEVPMLTNSNNPFEILRAAPPAADSNTTKTKTILEQAAPSLLNRETYSKNFLFWVFLITLSLMALVVANARSAIRDAYQALLSNNALRQIYRLQAGWGNVAQLALYGVFLLNASIFAFLMYYRFVGKPPMNQFWTFTFCLLGVCGAFLIKHTILYIVSSVFPIAKEVKLYNFIIITGGILLGLILLPLNIFIAYSPEILGNFLTYTAFFAISLVYLVRSIRGLSVASPFLATDQLHFLVYLCAVEIAPLMVLTKLIISK